MTNSMIRIKGRQLADFTTLRSHIQPEVYAFLEEWFNDRDHVLGHTSGSTGIPKEIRLFKEDMRASARITNSFFSITENSSLLLSLSASYIAGKMMIVRALEAGAELWLGPVTSHPLRGWQGIGKKIDLAAMVPMQLEETLKNQPERRALDDICQLLIGGAPVSGRLEEDLKERSGDCYATYGMTETVSHIALRRLNHDPDYFALGEVRFSVDERECLVIHAPHLKARQFITNDRVILKDHRHFEWLGRWDHVINSGGIKFFPEVIEKKIAAYIPERFFITSVADRRLGQKMVLVIEKVEPGRQFTEQLLKKLTGVLTPYELPKEIIYLSCFQETTSGKVIRKLS